MGVVLTGHDLARLAARAYTARHAGERMAG